MAIRRILMVAYHYPPVRVSSGIQRTLKFSSYLRDHGWEPMVLTISPRAYEKVGDDQMGEIPRDMLVERAFGLNTVKHLSVKGRYFRWMALPDRWASWFPAAVWQGVRMIRLHRPAVVFSTYPIATAHWIGLALARLSGLPWVADFRDSMTEPDYPPDPLTWRVQRRLEQWTVRRCARAVFTTEGARAMYAERYPGIPASRWAVIENGFDEENFRDAESGFERRPLGRAGQLTLVHSGVLYPYERDPRPFFSALRALLGRGEISPDGLQIVLRATGADEVYRPMLEEQGLSGIVRLEPSVGYRDALREMLCADGLLVFQAAGCNHQVPAKVYEYFRAGRPIFALTDSAGDTAGVLRGAGVGDIANIADAEEIEAGLRAFLRAVAEGRARGVAPEAAAAHSRRARTAELARLLAEVAG